MMSIYQLSTGYVIGGLKYDRTATMPHAGVDQALELKILGKEGAWFELWNGAKSYPLDVNSLSETIMLGKGFQRRYWTGEIEVLLAVYGVPVPPGSIGVHPMSGED